MPFGDQLKRLRKENKITQEHLADELYVSRQTISNWENNKSYPSMDFIITISTFFDVSVDTLIREKNDYTQTKNNILVQERIEKNKYRIVLNRLIFIRFNFVWVGSLFTTYFLTANRYMDYIIFPISLLIIGLLGSIPIHYIQKKYNLKTREDFSNFLDELYK